MAISEVEPKLEPTAGIKVEYEPGHKANSKTEDTVEPTVEVKVEEVKIGEVKVEPKVELELDLDPDDYDVTDDLDALGRELERDTEIERIRSVFRLNAYAVLDLLPGVPESDIKRTYKAKSLLIHPDKTPNPNAPDAFDRIKKAQQMLLDEKLRVELDEHIADARMLTMRDKKLTADDDEVKSEEFAKAWRDKTTFVIMEHETRKQRILKADLREEGRAQRKEEEELEERKRKREHESAWEQTRDVRINSWRNFQQGKRPEVEGGKKKKKKVKALG
ncbi:hypothetical protein BDV95DRAFT_547091 [Massariosphaeria phaeospora]|uniref:J domain-containing protein n=1 Tax=Massariosphaeria phaeospora TaxID=100035 RepID=A0A7C8MHU7_9PLEO|nr:hypothetical protein BDV95DRAFT_547091 [Massariosphaeria phaeospora]